MIPSTKLDVLQLIEPESDTDAYTKVTENREGLHKRQYIPFITVYQLPFSIKSHPASQSNNTHFTVDTSTLLCKGFVQIITISCAVCGTCTYTYGTVSSSVR